MYSHKCSGDNRLIGAAQVPADCPEGAEQYWRKPFEVCDFCAEKPAEWIKRGHKLCSECVR